MKIINKSGNEECSSEDSFYLILSPEQDSWEKSFSFEKGYKYNTETEAIEGSSPGCVIAKVTLVAKIV